VERSTLGGALHPELALVPVEARAIRGAVWLVLAEDDAEKRRNGPWLSDEQWGARK
jgi:hypothetical protein